MAFSVLPQVGKVMTLVLTCIAIFATSLSCARQQRQKNTRQEIRIRITSPLQNSKVTSGDSITISYTCSSNKLQHDSVIAFLNQTPILKFNQEKSSKVCLKASKYGYHTLRIKAFNKNQVEQSKNIPILILPKNAPKLYSYKILNSFPHDNNAYTQGLEIHGDTLYESTGGYGTSSLRKVMLKTGKILQNLTLENNFFGEGMCCLNNLIYQLTWREQTCFVYDKHTMQLQKTLPYSGEGWGITSDGKSLIMSNGSAIIKFLNPESLIQYKTIEVCTHQGTLSNLNELEIINGELWANVYTTDIIARIDTASGAVNGIINLKEILPKHLYQNHTDVLNGIAYNKKTGKIFITGKNWQRIYEVAIIPTKYESVDNEP
ncbi:MAG: glutaminyl-peptide cyclotransferase [Bacteroidales bacterium]